MSCKYCNREDNDFVMLNETADYSGLEIAMNRQGILRIRHYSSNQMWQYKTLLILNTVPFVVENLRRKNDEITNRLAFS